VEFGLGDGVPKSPPGGLDLSRAPIVGGRGASRTGRPGPWGWATWLSTAA